MNTLAYEVFQTLGRILLQFNRRRLCGILAHGFLRAKCEECRHEKLIAFSCRCRGFCPSCGARRMAATTAHLVDEVMPHVPVRQWVLSLPIPLRYLLASHPELLSPVLDVVHRAISGWLIKKAGIKRTEAQAGGVTFVQRFGSALNLNIHFHCLVLDGVYSIAAVYCHRLSASSAMASRITVVMIPMAINPATWMVLG